VGLPAVGFALPDDVVSCVLPQDLDGPVVGATIEQHVLMRRAQRRDAVECFADVAHLPEARRDDGQLRHP
jgi:hypothetical protein